MGKHTLKKHTGLILLLKVISIVLLLMVPININGQDQTTDLAYWPPIISQLEEQYAQHPQDPKISESLANAYNNYGVLLAQNKQWMQAESNLQQAITLSPDSTAMKMNLSNIYFEHGNALFQTHTNYTTYSSYDAKQLANKSIAMDPSNANAYLLLGDIEYMDQQMTDAQRAWEHAAALLPNNQDVQKRLAQINREATVETGMNNIFNPYFNIKIDPGVGANTNFNANQILDYARTSVTADLQYYQATHIPVVVYNQNEYRETMVDAPGWAEAIYDGKIRIYISPDQKNFTQLTSDVVHEFTHVIVGLLTNNNCPRWFNEGLAKYEEYKHGVPPRIYLLALAYNTNETIDWSKMNEAIISPNKNEAVLAYQQAFSFVYYIVQRYSMNRIVALLKTLGTNVDFPTAIQQVYGVSLDTLENNWKLWLTDFITNWADAPATSEANY